MTFRLALFLAAIVSVASTVPSLAAGNRYALVVGNA
jgi:hypothetical protein